MGYGGFEPLNAPWARPWPIGVPNWQRIAGSVVFFSSSIAIDVVIVTIYMIIVMAEDTRWSAFDRPVIAARQIFHAWSREHWKLFCGAAVNLEFGKKPLTRRQVPQEIKQPQRINNVGGVSFPTVNYYTRLCIFVRPKRRREISKFKTSDAKRFE